MKGGRLVECDTSTYECCPSLQTNHRSFTGLTGDPPRRDRGQRGRLVTPVSEGPPVTIGTWIPSFWYSSCGNNLLKFRSRESPGSSRFLVVGTLGLSNYPRNPVKEQGNDGRDHDPRSSEYSGVVMSVQLLRRSRRFTSRAPSLSTRNRNKFLLCARRWCKKTGGSESGGSSVWTERTVGKSGLI